MRKYSKILAVLLVIAMLIPGISGIAQAAEVATESYAVRLFGSTRTGTAVDVSQEAYKDGTKTVVLAGYNAEVDALAGTLLASSKKAPLLITNKDNLSKDIKAEIKNLKAGKAFILGGEAAISEKVVNQLKEMGLEVERIKGENRAETAYNVAEKVSTNAKHIFLAKGYGKKENILSDALAVGPVSAKEEMPVLLTQTDKVPSSTIKAIKDLNASEITIIGGSNAVSDDIFNQLSKDYKVNRIEGANREETAIKIADIFFPNAKNTILANGYGSPDALVGGYLGALKKSPILFTSKNRIKDAIIGYLEANSNKTFVLGGQGVVNEETFKKVEEAVKPKAPNELAKEQLNANLKFLHKVIDNPSFGAVAGEWTILSLARGGYDTPKEYYELYESNVEEEVIKLMEKYNGKLNRNKGTEHSRLILGFTALGKDIKEVAGYDIREGLVDFNFATRQGINGSIFALIALDSNNYELPEVEGVENESTREKFIEYILEREIKGENEELAGWSLRGEKPDPDITGMAIQGLTPYYKERADVKMAVDRGVAWLSEAQTSDGGYKSGWGGENIESASQVVVALTGLGIDPHNDRRFVKNGISVIDNILTFSHEDGGFMHVKAGEDTGGGGAAGQVDLMATDQGTYALVAYDRFVNNQNRLYDMTDIGR